MKNKYLIFFLFVVCAFTFSDEVHLMYPTYFPIPTYDISKEKLAQDKIDLGRILFYDPILSKDSTISCESCHSPYNAFAHTDHDLSHGINDSIGLRNAPSLVNLAWHKSFMWDGTINHLDMQALAPITDAGEMGETLSNVLSKMQNTKRYPKLFYHAFGDSIISSKNLLKALTQFQLTLISSNSKYDMMKQGRDTFSKQEANGYQLFKNHCNTCHTEPLFTNHEFKNNGLSLDPSLNDVGRYKVTLNPKDSLHFKVPTLRNLTYTFPYMHDGRLASLSAVINHYHSDLSSQAYLSSEIKTPISLTSNEKVDLISFLLTLNDKTFVFNKNNTYPHHLMSKIEGNQ